MTPRPLRRVVVIGAGLGGLALAQRLVRAGIAVDVYERDRHRKDRPQGYRLHINPAGAEALQKVLPDDLYRLFLATCGRQPTAMTFYTEQLRRLLAVDLEPESAHYSVSRDILRQILLARLDGVVHYAKAFRSYRVEDNGCVTAFFEDGSSVTGDVLIAADGVGSRVRQQYLPQTQLVDTGLVSIAGRVPLSLKVRSLVPERLFSGPAAISAPQGVGLFLAVQEFSPLPKDIGATAVALEPTPDFVSWGLGAERSAPALAALPTRPTCASGDMLFDLVRRLTAEWHPDLRALIAATDPHVITLSVIRSSQPVPTWRPSTITLLGDAIHSMTPARGIGANTALRDAALLAEHLIAVHGGQEPLAGAIGDYEREMTSYGFRAVAASLKELQAQRRSGNPIARGATHASLRLLDRIPPLKKRIFARLGE
jgi:2-polyprenyl-6-methoxyphenol hydroxylase-like FAD-dependent oxidoreductase